MTTKEADKWYELGRCSTIQEVGRELLVMAGNLYGANEPDNAAFCKGLSEEYLKRGKALRADYDKNYPKP